jgi:hypothetical protein
MDARWTEYENAATYDYARKFVEDNYRPKAEQETLKQETQMNRVCYCVHLYFIIASHHHNISIN